jgi:hypothetical protein
MWRVASLSTISALTKDGTTSLLKLKLQQYLSKPTGSFMPEVRTLNHGGRGFSGNLSPVVGSHLVPGPSFTQ